MTNTDPQHHAERFDRVYAEVHTTEDPGSPTGFGSEMNAPVSEAADAIAHNFEPNEVLNMLGKYLRIVHYEERREFTAKRLPWPCRRTRIRLTGAIIIV